MTASAGTRTRPGSTSTGEHTQAKRSRGTYRRQLTAPRPGASSAGAETKRAAAVVLEVLAGVRTPTSAAAVLGIKLPRYYLLEERAVQGLISACEPRRRGRTVTLDRRLAQMERELAVARRDLGRQQALARTTQRALGLPAAVAASPPSTPAGKARAGTTEPKRRKRRPSVRALRAARFLQTAESPDFSGDSAPTTVQTATGSPAMAGPAGGPDRPAAVEPSRGAQQAEHGGTSHAGRPKAVGNS